MRKRRNSSGLSWIVSVPLVDGLLGLPDLIDGLLGLPWPTCSAACLAFPSLIGSSLAYCVDTMLDTKKFWFILGGFTRCSLLRGTPHGMASCGALSQDAPLRIPCRMHPRKMYPCGASLQGGWRLPLRELGLYA